MKSSERLHGKRIIIKKEDSTFSKKQTLVDKSIHVRRHSVIGSRLHERGESGPSQSYQSSKEIKSLSKQKGIREDEYLYENEKTEKFCSSNMLR